MQPMAPDMMAPVAPEAPASPMAPVQPVQPAAQATPPQDPPLVAQRKQELLNYVQNFYRRSWDWRSTNFHTKWDRFDRNYHSIYDPQKKAEKEPWQATMFVDITLQNTEIIVSQIHKTMMAPNPPIQTVAGPAGDDLQARLIQETMSYELMKAKFTVAFYDALKEAVRYGSGFIKFYWERVEDTRRRRVAVQETPQEMLAHTSPEALTGQVPMGTPAVKGFAMQPTRVLVKNCLASKMIHIRDIFPDPNTTDWKAFIHRDKIPYGTIVRHIKRGEFFDVHDKLEGIQEGNKFEADITDIKQERGYYDANRQFAKFEKLHTIWELWNNIPRKWIQFDMPDGDDAEELVPAKVMVASGIALLASEENEKFDAEPPVVPLNYIRTGETYGKGIPEILEQDQDEINENTNLGIDNLNLIINKGIAVLDNALVNPDQDLEVKPGWKLRLKSQVTDDVRKAFAPIDFPDLASSYFRHRFDIERMVQEKTGANRVTLGSSGAVKDTNQTLGGMELLRQMFNERVAAYGMVMEAASLMVAAEKIYGLIYQELNPDDLKPILGEEPVTIGEHPDPITGQPVPFQVPRYLAFAFVPPEEVNRSYRFKPMGIFSLENKVVKTAQIMDMVRVLGGDPRFDVISAMKYVAVNLQQIEEAEKWFLNIPMMPMPGMPGGAPPPGGPGGPGGPMPAGPKPGMQGGPNGNQPAFLPPNPLRRQPVVG